MKDRNTDQTAGAHVIAAIAGILADKTSQLAERANELHQMALGLANGQARTRQLVTFAEVVDFLVENRPAAAQSGGVHREAADGAVRITLFYLDGGNRPIDDAPMEVIVAMALDEELDDAFNGNDLLILS